MRAQYKRKRLRLHLISGLEKKIRADILYKNTVKRGGHYGC